MLPCPSDLNEKVWNFSFKLAMDSKSHAERVSSDLDWESKCVELTKNQTYHNLNTPIEELTKEWYDFAEMMSHNKDSYWATMFLTTPE